MEHIEGTYVLPYNKIDTDIVFTPAHRMASSIFLAGPCPRENYGEDWRFEAADILRRLGFKGNIISPTNDQFMTMRSNYGLDMLRQQTEWERYMMHMCSALVFWVPRSEKWPAMTTNVEYGEWYKKEGVFFGYPEGAIKNEYLELKLHEQHKTAYHTLEDILKAAMEHIYRPADTYFTADTHFGQERTLQLSRRPFVDVEEMDLEMISNWNKKIPESGIVYHAGDLIDPAQLDDLSVWLSNLNFAELHWVLGNYDRKHKDKIIELVKTIDRKIFIYDLDKPCYVTLKKEDGTEVKFRVIHEPADFEYQDDADITYLFGHIHGRSFAKRNGFDIACDYSNYTPLSSGQVLWFKNAMQYWDKNVYCDRVNRVADTFEYEFEATAHSYHWPKQAIESFMRLPEEKRIATIGKNEADYPICNIDLSTAVGTVKSMNDGKITVVINKDWPQGKLVADMLGKKVPIKYCLAGAADVSMIIERDINDPSATITEAQLKYE